MPPSSLKGSSSWEAPVLRWLGTAPPFPTEEQLPPQHRRVLPEAQEEGGLCQKNVIFSAGKRDEGYTSCQFGQAAQ